MVTFSFAMFHYNFQVTFTTTLPVFILGLSMAMGIFCLLNGNYTSRTTLSRQVFFWCNCTILSQGVGITLGLLWWTCRECFKKSNLTGDTFSVTPQWPIC